jgi:hypothetical protein
MTNSTDRAVQDRRAARFHLGALTFLGVLATLALAVILAVGAGRELLVGTLLVPVIAFPALGPLFFTGWVFAADTNR